jgi:hypothetical protein
MAAAGLAQVRPGGAVEPALVTSGEDFSLVRDLSSAVPAGAGEYGAADVVARLAAAVLNPA